MDNEDQYDEPTTDAGDDTEEAGRTMWGSITALAMGIDTNDANNFLSDDLMKSIFDDPADDYEAPKKVEWDNAKYLTTNHLVKRDYIDAQISVDAATGTLSTDDVMTGALAMNTEADAILAYNGSQWTHIVTGDGITNASITNNVSFNQGSGETLSEILEAIEARLIAIETNSGHDNPPTLVLTSPYDEAANAAAAFDEAMKGI